MNDLLKQDTIENVELEYSYFDFLPKPIKNLISWKYPLVTGIVAAACIIMSIILKIASFISLIAYIGLLFVTSSMVFRLYLNLTNKKDIANPFEELCDKDMKRYLDTISEIVQYQTSNEESGLNNSIKYLRNVLLFNSYMESLKFLMVNVVMVYLGQCINLIDLLLLVILSFLTGPKLYSMYKVQIDETVLKIRNQVSHWIKMLKEKISVLPVFRDFGKTKKMQ